MIKSIINARYTSYTTTATLDADAVWKGEVMKYRLKAYTLSNSNVLYELCKIIKGNIT